MSEKTRVDLAMVQRGLADSREKAQAQIMAGLVYVDENKVLKPSELVIPMDNLLVRGAVHPYVSRGGLKLEKALKAFNADVTGLVAMDIGAATGGFTDVLLRNGARHVYAIDVGYGQLDWKIRNHPQVTVMERTNARFLTKEQLPLQPALTVMDVSFISIRLILPKAAEIMGDEGCFYTLIKPQFEAGKERVGKKGVVRDPKVHEDVIWEIVEFVRGAMGWEIDDLSFSPITGPEGNIEFLAKIVKASTAGITLDDVKALVKSAHDALEKNEKPC